MTIAAAKFALTLVLIGGGIILAIYAFFPIGHKQDRSE